MITKERLEELIEQGATIYSIYWEEEVDLSQKCEIIEKVCYDGKNRLVLIAHEDETHSPNYLLENLTEDIEGAKWEEEFGCIERTERLELPTYECMQPKEDEQDVYYNFYNYNHELMGIRVTKQCIALYKSYRCSDLTSTIDIFDNTKENYTLACRKAKELFLGEKK